MEDEEQASPTSQEEESNTTSTLSESRNDFLKLEEESRRHSELRSLIGFRDLVGSISLNNSFEEECEKYPLELYFVDVKETRGH